MTATSPLAGKFTLEGRRRLQLAFLVTSDVSHESLLHGKRRKYRRTGFHWYLAPVMYSDSCLISSQVRNLCYGWPRS